MTPHKTIILNTLVTYGRSLFSMALGIFSIRWVLEGLGDVDYGLYGVIASVLGFAGFVNGLMAMGIARFYAYSIGMGHNMTPLAAVDDLKRWFNVSLTIHLVLIFILIPIAYPIGIYAINNWLTIPLDRVETCIWVFRIGLITLSLNIISVPFLTMFTAHQDILEVSLWGLVQTIAGFICAYKLPSISSERLLIYAVYLMIIGAGIPVLQIIRAYYKYKACRVKRSYLWEKEAFRKLFSFVGWSAIATFGDSLKTQGTVILINIYFGPSINAAYGLGNAISSQAASFSQALLSAFSPAIISSEGSGNRSRTIDYALKTCKFGTFLVMLFVIPLLMELSLILKFWLKTPPECCLFFCFCMISIFIIQRTTFGLWIAIDAHGDIKKPKSILSVVFILCLPIMFLCVKAGMGVASVAVALIITMVLFSVICLYFSEKQLGLSVKIWLKMVLLPLIQISFVAVIFGACIRMFFEESFLRVCGTSVACLLGMVVAGWFFLFSEKEKEYIMSKIR